MVSAVAQGSGRKPLIAAQDIMKGIGMSVNSDAPDENRPRPSSQEVSSRMSAYPRRDTTPELRLRREVHRRGLRYLVDAPLPGMPRRRADLLFSRAKVAVFVDGCYWHGCPLHFRPAGRNLHWWKRKIAVNQARDRDTDERLTAQGWNALRFWEHEDMILAATTVERTVRREKLV